jgi:hypothetical protein
VQATLTPLLFLLPFALRTTPLIAVLSAVPLCFVVVVVVVVVVVKGVVRVAVVVVCCFLWVVIAMKLFSSNYCFQKLI